jgi:hypothetical protein
MPKSTPPVSSREKRAALTMGRNLLQRAKNLLRREKICITFGKGGPITQLDTQKLNNILPGLELTINELSEIFTALESVDVSYEKRLRLPVGDLAAFFRRYGSNLSDQMPAILAFYSIIRTARSEVINVGVWVEGRTEPIDIQDVPSSKAHAVKVFETMQHVSEKVLNADLVEAEEHFQLWLEEANKDNINFFFRDIIAQIKQATAPTKP